MINYGNIVALYSSVREWFSRRAPQCILFPKTGGGGLGTMTNGEVELLMPP